MTDWARDYFEHGYALRWTLGPPSDETQHEANALSGLLKITPNAGILDVGCGHGRLAVALAQRGAHVTGLDFASQLLTRAQALAQSFSVLVTLVRGDMRCLPFRANSMQGAILFDAFGFFENEEENLAVLRELARVLAPGARAVLKVVNAEPILREFRARDRETRGNATIEIDRTLLTSPSRLVETIVLTGPSGNRRYERRQRLYRVEELSAAMNVAGLSVVSVLAAVTGAPFEPTDSASMVIIGERA